MNMSSPSKTENLSLWIEGEIKRFIKSPENNLNIGTGESAWAEPMVGFSNGSDPLYLFYKEDIGDFYLTPIEFFEHHFPDLEVTPEQLTVISWVLPQTDATKTDNRKETHFPSERWARSRIFGELVNDKLRKHMVDVLTQAGIESVAPVLSPIWERKISKRYGYASSWSERHTAYTAGLGTFGLSDGLITLRGKAMRVGSVIARMWVPPSKRPYKDHNAYCLFYAKGTCGDCIERCPIGAITKEGHDKFLCSKYVRMTRQYVARHFGFDGYGCGLCQTGVPCESGIPLGIEGV